MIAVYNIDETCERKEHIGDNETRNIDKIFESLLGGNLIGLDGEKYFYNITLENHFLSIFRQQYFPNKNVNDSTFDDFAERLLRAELVSSGERRNQKITKGLLFIRFYYNKLIFLKLEQVDSIDKDTYEISASYAIDKKYYKAAIYTGDDAKITIIDKNGKVANYWSGGFLCLERSRDNRKNTKDLIKIVKNESILNPSIEKDKRTEYLKNIIRYIKHSRTFDLDALIDSIGLNNDYDSPEDVKNNVFNLASFENMDASFDIDDEERGKLFSVNIVTSDNTSIKNTNLVDSVRSREIDIDEEGYLKIRIDDGKIDQVRETIEKYRVD